MVSAAAQVAIAAGYFPAYARLPRKAQRKADEFIRKFSDDPKQASIHYEPIQGAVDKQLRSVRVGDDYRAVVRAPEQGNVFLLLWIDHHDEAYRWAEGKQIQVHPKTGTIQFFDVDAASAAVTSTDGDPSVTADDDPGSSTRSNYKEKRLFSDYSDEQLFAGGVPSALLPAVRALYTDVDLDSLVEHLPQEAADLLTGLAAGYEYDAVIEQILEKPSPAAAPNLEPVDTADIEAALKRDSSQRQFRLLDENFDLDKALTYPLDVWRVYLHPSQRKVVQAHTKGPMRLTGGAGTGKTVVAMHRAAFLLRSVFKAPDDRVLVTTFTKNLAHDIHQNLGKLLEPEDLARAEVVNIDAWAADFLRSRSKGLRFATRKHQDDAWRSALDLYGLDGFDLQFCRSEWDAVIQAQNIRDLDGYVRAVRHHRGTPLSRADRRKLWDVFAEYRSSLDAEGVSEAVDILRAARQELETKPLERPYRSVVVDETQDMSGEALRLVRTLAGAEGPNDLLLVGDAHQRIYGRPVPLSHSGINVRGRRSRELRLNYRTTAAICRWSLRTLGDSTFDDLDEGKSSTRGYVSLRQGERPVVRHFTHLADEREFIVEQIRQLLRSGRSPEEICIVARTGKLLQDGYGSALAKAGIEYEVLEKQQPRSSSVRLATMHRVKGLEFPVVFVAAVNAGLLPLATADLSSDDSLVAEQARRQERCLLYVATSRARDRLYVTSYGERSEFLENLDVRAPAAAVHAEENLGRKSVADTEREARNLPSSKRDPDLEEVLDEFVADWPLPTRMHNWAERAGITTVRELAARRPVELIGEPNLGRGSIVATRHLLETRLGRRWEELQRYLAQETTSEEGASQKLRWNSLQQTLPPSILQHDLVEVPLPTRMRNHVEAEGLETVAQLLAIPQADLAARKNVGRASIRLTQEALLQYVAGLEQRRLVWESGFLPSLKDVLQDLDTIPRMVVTRRAGLGAQPETLEEIGSTLGVTRERIRQIEKKTWDAITRSKAWTTFLSERCQDAAPGGAVALEELEELPWWRGLATEPDALDYFCDRLLHGKWRVIQLEGQRYLAQVNQSTFDDVRAQLKRSIRKLAFPLPLSQVAKTSAEITAPVGATLAQALASELLERLVVEEAEGSEPRAVGYGSGKNAQILAFLNKQAEPVSINELVAEVGRAALPDEVFIFGHGKVGLERHFPDFARWKADLGPAAVRLMEQNGPERQWACADLLDDLREDVELPKWLDHWHLGAILRRSPGVEYLGRQRVALPGVADASGRVYVHVALERILADAGHPLPYDDLVARLREKADASDLAIVGRLHRAPFLKVGKAEWGLLGRDLPGGIESMTEALDHLEAVLERRQRGLSTFFVHRELSQLSAIHATWTADMGLSITRGDPRFRLSISGNLGLSGWESVRVPARSELARTAIEQSDGRVSVQAISDRITALYGAPPDRPSLASWANRFGARLDGDWIVRVG